MSQRLRVEGYNNLVKDGKLYVHGFEPINVPWMNAFELDKQFTNFKIR